jgi:1-acyl-sn-glycerol-3-phosphate acyltransferase
MRPPPTPVRRVLIDPLWVPLALLLAVALLAVGACSVLAAPLGRRRLLRVTAFGALYLLLDAAMLVSCAATWLRHPVPRWRDEDAWSRAHERLLRRALSLLVAASWPLFGFRVRLEEPPDQARLVGRPLLVLARHGGPGDSFALVEMLLSRYGRRPVIVLKETLRWDPGLDVLLTRIPSCFIPARSAGVDVPARLAGMASRLRPRDAMLIFPEGGNWTPRRHRRALTRLRLRGHRKAAAAAAANAHVLPPQPTGVLACLDARQDLHVVVVAHTGLDNLVSPAMIWRALPVTGRPMIVRWWHQPAASLPAAPEDREEWLRVQWAIVDSWIDARQAGSQPAQVQPTQFQSAEGGRVPVAEVKTPKAADD